MNAPVKVFMENIPNVSRHRLAPDLRGDEQLDFRRSPVDPLRLGSVSEIDTRPVKKLNIKPRTRQLVTVEKSPKQLVVDTHPYSSKNPMVEPVLEVIEKNPTSENMIIEETQPKKAGFDLTKIILLVAIIYLVKKFML